jgi:hypothetical protein
LRKYETANFVQLCGSVLIVFLVGVSSLLSAGISSGAQRDGVIMGDVEECGPGPVVPPPSVATPAMVVLLHRNRTYESQAIVFPKDIPWIGQFKFEVPPGRYSVISSYGGAERWVTVKTGSRTVVGFGVIGCPE